MQPIGDGFCLGTAHPVAKTNGCSGAGTDGMQKASCYGVGLAGIGVDGVAAFSYFGSIVNLSHVGSGMVEASIVAPYIRRRQIGEVGIAGIVGAIGIEIR